MARDDYPASANLFFSYAYRGRATRGLERFPLAKDRTGNIVIDSGAHSFFAVAGVSVTSGANAQHRDVPIDFEKYVRGYVEWLKLVYDKIDFFVEVDIQELVGQETVWRWRDLYSREGLGKKCIWVYHSGIGSGGVCDTYKDFERMVDESESRYVGIEGKRKQKFQLPYVKMAKHAYDNDCRTHVFAAVVPALMRRAPLYSTDSQSWGAGIQFGVVFRFDPKAGMMKMKPKADAKTAVRYGPVSYTHLRAHET